MPRITPPTDRTRFAPGDSSMVKMLKVVRWALLRGGRFTAPELMRRFGCSKNMAYSYTYAWRAVFGEEPPPRSRLTQLELDERYGKEPEKPVIPLSSLMEHIDNE